MKHLLHFLVTLLSISVANAQKQYIVSIDELLGYNILSVYEINQDQLGYIYFTSEQGLIRFDGYKYKTYTHSNMSSKAGAFIHVDKNNYVWYGNFDGEFYSLQQDSLHKISFPKNSSLTFQIVEDTIYYVHQTTLIKKSLKNGETLDIVSLPTFRNVKFGKDHFQLHESFNKNLHYYSINGDHQFKLQISEDTYPQIFEYNGEYYAVQANENGIKILVYRKNDFKIVAHYPLHTSISNVRMHDNVLNICTKSGLLSFDLSQSKFNRYLESHNVFNYYKDRNENEWIATSRGLYLLSSGNSASMIPLNSQNYQIHKIIDEIWLSDISGNIYKYNHDAHNLSKIYTLPNQQRVYTLFASNNPSTIQRIENTRRIFEGNTFTYKNHQIAALITGIKSYEIIDDAFIATAMSGNCEFIDIRNSNNVSTVWDTLYNQHIITNTLPHVSNIINSTRGKSIAYDSIQKIILIATNNGLYRITPNLITEMQYKNDNFYAEKIIEVNSHFILLTNNGELFITNGHDPIQPLIAFNQNTGILDIEQHGNKIIIRNKHTIQLIDAKDLNQSPIPSIYLPLPITTKSIHQSTIDDSLLYILSGDKLITFPYHKDSQHSHIKFIPEYIKFNNVQHSILPQIHIPSNSEDIKLHFSIIDLNHKVYELSYQINNGEWRTLSPSERTILFASLSPDTYHIKFRINGEILPETITIIKSKPWYLQWWFFLSLAATIIFIIVQYFNNRFRNQAIENKLELEKKQLENDLRQSLLSSIKSQMNPHFLFNALNTIQSYIITEDKENASRYLSMYARLTRNILEMSDKEYISLDAEIKTINLYVALEQMRFPDITYKIHIAPEIDVYQSYIPSMIIQPFIENAIKHGLLHKRGKKELTINIEQEKDDFKISIRDNGIGRKQSQILNEKSKTNHRSFAARANLKRVELLNLNKNDIVWNYIDHEDAHQQPLGTELILIIPIKYNHYD